MSRKSLFREAKYRSWVKAGCGIKYLKDGLEPFVDEILKHQHQNILVKSSGSVNKCNKCNLRTLKPSHVCNRYKKCPLGHTKCNCQYPSGKHVCPLNVCGIIYDECIGSHASIPPTPNWNNINSQLWCTDHWEFGKCFINAPGYAQKNKASDIDCSGLLHVIINDTEFQSHIQCSITGSDIFTKARGIRNSLFHSASMELDDTKADEYIDVMIAILEDPKELHMRPECITAVQNLKELKKDKFVIRQETEEEVLRAAGILIEEERTNRLHQRVNDLEDEMKMRSEDQENLNKSVVSLSKRITRLESQHKDTASFKKKLAGLREDIESMRAFDAHKEQLDYIRRKRDLKSKLIETYRRKVIRSSVLPLRSGQTACISDVYTTPWMVVATECQVANRQVENGIAINSLEEIFTKDGKPVKTVYIIGETGSGKSAVCKYMVHEWCEAHSGGQIEQLTANAEEMKKFDFLFFLPLRYNKNVDGDNIHKMIQKQFEAAALEILENESEACLIIMDGLDEWTPSLQLRASQFQPQGIPARNLTKEYTTITTSRPWKVHELNLDESEMNQLIELRGISKTSIESFVIKAIRYIDKTCDAESFTKDLQNSPVFDLATVPFMLLQLKCVWVVHKNIGTSSADICSRMVSSLFVWCTQTERNKNILNVLRDRVDFCTDTRFDKIRYVKHLKLFENNKFLILKIAELAFSMQFSKENYSVSIGQNELEFLNIDSQIENSFLKLGLLTKERNVDMSQMEQSTSYSFIHAILQEYFAALYITTQCQASATDRVDTYMIIAEHLKECKTVEDILKHSNVLVMICALDTALMSYISQFIFRVVNADKQFAKYRKDSESSVHAIYLIQDIIFSCISESTLQEGLTLCNLFSLGDLIIDSSTNTKLCENIDPKTIRSINIQDCDKLTEELFDSKSLSEYPTDDAESTDVSMKTEERYALTTDNSDDDSESQNLADKIVNDSDSPEECGTSRYTDESTDSSIETNESVDLIYNTVYRNSGNDSGYVGERERYGSDASEECSETTSFIDRGNESGYVDPGQKCRYDDVISRSDSIGEESVDSSNEAYQTPQISDNDYTESETSYLNFLAKNVHKFQPEKLCIRNCNLSEDDVLTVRKMLNNSCQAIKCMALQQKQKFPCSDSSIISTLVMSKVTQLTSLNLQLYESLSREDFERLGSFLGHNLSLEQVVLANIRCASKMRQDDHEFSFVGHKNLKRVSFSYCDFLVDEVCCTKLQECKLESVDHTVARNIMFSLIFSKITMLHLETICFGKDDILFPYLRYLKEIKFTNVKMTHASWISCISKFKLMPLRYIEIKTQTLNQEIWRRFVDDVSVFKKYVLVDTYDLKVVECEPQSSYYDGPSRDVTEEARQYVKEKGLHVLHEHYDTFEFEKK